MKVLSVQQPWARRVIFGDKDVESRRWTTAYRGRIAIHASSQPDWEAPAWVWEAAGLPVPDLTSPKFIKKRFLARIQDALGVILGEVELHDIIVGACSRWAARGQWNWLLRGPKPYADRIPWKGAAGRMTDWPGAAA